MNDWVFLGTVVVLIGAFFYLAIVRPQGAGPEAGRRDEADKRGDSAPTGGEGGK